MPPSTSRNILASMVGCFLLSVEVRPQITAFPASASSTRTVTPGYIFVSPDFLSETQTPVSDYEFSIQRSGVNWTCLYVGYLDLDPCCNLLTVRYGTTQEPLDKKGEHCYSDTPVNISYTNSAPYGGKGFYVTSSAGTSPTGSGLVEPSGYIRWKDYAPNQKDTWRLEASGSEIILEFSEFELISNTDYLKIYDDRNNSGIPFAELTGTRANGYKLKLPQSTFTLVAESGGSSTKRQGFILAYYDATDPDRDNKEHRRSGYNGWWMFGMVGPAVGVPLGIWCHRRHRNRRRQRIAGKTTACGTVCGASNPTDYGAPATDYGAPATDYGAPAKASPPL